MKQQQTTFLDDAQPPIPMNYTARDREREGIATGPPTDLPRLNKQCQAILERLRLGPATNKDLNAICFRYGARLKELRDAGYPISSERKQGGTWIYKLKK